MDELVRSDKEGTNVIVIEKLSSLLLLGNVKIFDLVE